MCKKEFNAFDSSTWEVDHIIPRFAGGLDMYDNLQLLHKECHELKTKADMLGYKPKKKRAPRKGRKG